MTALRLRIILNPAAGSITDINAVTGTIRKILPDAEIVMAHSREELVRLAREGMAAGCDAVVAGGGDGSVNGILNALAGRIDEGVCIGALPLGTGNDFVRTMGIPDDLEHALAVLRDGFRRRIDIVRVTNGTGERLQINAAAGGFSTKVSEEATGDVKETWGRLGYARAFVGALPRLDDYHTRIELNDGEVITTPAYNVVVANARYVAGGVPIAPQAEVDDGLADVVVLPVASLAELAVLGPLTLLGKHVDSDRILTRRARTIRIESDPEMPFNVDGELIGSTPIRFEVRPRAIEFIVGPSEVKNAAEGTPT